MASDPDSAIWPVPAFLFRVRLGRKQVQFTQVSGLEALLDGQPGKVRLTRGIFRGDVTLWRWFEGFAGDPDLRATVTIDLLEADLKPARRWQLEGVRPVRIFGPELDSQSNGVATETLEIACQSIKVTRGR